MSAAGGVGNAPERGGEIGATAIQVFTKTPNQWREPKLAPQEIERFKSEIRRLDVRAVVSHDSYLINLASPDPMQWERSVEGLKGELTRCQQLGIPFVVTHPGNYMDNRDRGLKRNARAYNACLTAVRGPMILIESTAGTGTALGATFEELAQLRRLVSPRLRRRIGFCADTCHLFAAGYDLVNDWSGVWADWDEIIGLNHLRCLHLNDSKTPFGSRRDRHEAIGEGTLGPEPFRKIMRDRRFRGKIKIIETPTGDDPVKHDRRMLRRLRAYAKRRARRKP